MSSTTDGLLAIPAPQFRAYFDRKPFYLGHKLAGHPLFRLPELAALSTRLPPAVVEHDEGPAGTPTHPERIRRPARPCAATILDVERQPCWVLLRDVQWDARYGRLLEDIFAELWPHADVLRPGACRQGNIFISSRPALTPFHLDPEHDFLLQIRGSKTLHMWDPRDRGVPQPHDDRYLAWAWRLPLPAGSGVHVPLHAPHWVRTEGDVSISFSVTFRSHAYGRRELPHRASVHPRRPLLTPATSGRSRFWDTAAQLGMRAFANVRRRVHRHPA
jgi:hypothetical protein